MKTCLVVDDSSVIRKIARRILEEMDFQIIDVDLFNKPAIVLSVENGTGHGSCRSIAAFDMLGALERCADLFDRRGALICRL